MTITTATLRLRESRIIAGLLLQELDRAAWVKAIFDDNVLQLGSYASIRRTSDLLRARLAPMGKELWRMVRDGDQKLAIQATFAGAVNDSRLLGDFLDLAVREQRQLYAKHIEDRVWADSILACRGSDPDMPEWSDSTVSKLRSTVFSMLAEAGYLDNTRTRTLQTVFVDPVLAAYLRDRGNNYVLRCLQVTE